MFLQLVNYCLSQCFLLSIFVKNYGSVLRSHIRTLAIKCSGVMGEKKHFVQLTQSNFLWIKRYLHYLNMPRFTRTDLLIAWIIQVTPAVAGLNFHNTPQALKNRFGTPKTSASENNRCNHNPSLLITIQPKIKSIAQYVSHPLCSPVSGPAWARLPSARDYLSLCY